MIQIGLLVLKILLCQSVTMWAIFLTHGSCISRHWGVQLISAYSWARPAILVAGKGRGGMFLFLLFLHFQSCSSFFPSLFFSSLLLSLLSLSSLSLGDDTKWPTRVDVSLNPNTINLNSWQNNSEVSNLIWLKFKLLCDFMPALVTCKFEEELNKTGQEKLGDAIFHHCKSVGHFGSCSNQGPVVQSVVSLTSSLRVISLTVLADSIYNIMIFFAEKMWVAFAMQKPLTFFQQKISAYLRITQVNFNESLTNDVVSFEQLGPDFWKDLPQTNMQSILIPTMLLGPYRFWFRLAYWS